MKYACQQCGVEFRSYNPSPKYCSLRCKGDAQAPPLDIERIRVLYIAGKTQSEIGAALGVSQKTIHKAMRRHMIKARRAYKRDQWGDKNHQWKGDEASKQAFHRRLYSRFGKPTRCAVCGTSDRRWHYDYANLTGNYESADDYLPMCRSCHWRFDSKHLNFQGGEKNA